MSILWLGLGPTPCAAGDALAGLSPASWGPGAEGCDLLAGRGLGGPAGGDLRKLSARPSPGPCGLRPVRPRAAGASLVGLSPASGAGGGRRDLLAGRGLGGPAGGDLRKLSARPRSAARAALCCR